MSGLEHYFEVSGLAFSLLTSHSHAHKFYDRQTIPGVDGFADSMSVRGLPRMVSFQSSLLFCVSGSMSILCIAKIADTSFIPRSLIA